MCPWLTYSWIILGLQSELTAYQTVENLYSSEHFNSRRDCLLSKKSWLEVKTFSTARILIMSFSHVHSPMPNKRWTDDALFALQKSNKANEISVFCFYKTESKYFWGFCTSDFIWSDENVPNVLWGSARQADAQKYTECVHQVVFSYKMNLKSLMNFAHFLKSKFLIMIP